MSDSETRPVTQLLEAVSQGDHEAQDRLWSLVYDELHAMAKNQLRGDPVVQELQTTSLVNEVYIKLVGKGSANFVNRKHFFGAAARAMRQIRIDKIREMKRKGLLKTLAMPASEVGKRNPDPSSMLAIDQALADLDKFDPRKAEMVMMRFFLGMKVKEIAEVLGISVRTVELDWQVAKAWLHRELSKGDTEAPDRN